MAFEGLELDIDVPVRVPLRHPITGAILKDEEGREGYLELISFDSPAPSRLYREQQARAAKKGRPISPDELDENMTALLAVATVGWHLVTLEGKAIPVPFTPKDARALYANPKLRWIRKLVDEALSDAANFLPKPSAS